MSERPFSIQRGAGNYTKDRELSFIRELGDYALGFGVGLDASLGMTAVELVRRNEIESLQAEFPHLNKQEIELLLEKYKLDPDSQLRHSENLEIVGARLYEVEDGRVWLGGELSAESQDGMADDRDDLSYLLSEATGSKIELLERDHFVNIGVVYNNMSASEPLVEYVAEKLPDRLFVYDVDVH